MEKNILPKQLEDITSEFLQNLFFKQILSSGKTL